MCRYVVLAPNGTEQVTLLNNTASDKKLSDMPEYKALLTTFITNEVSGSPSGRPWHVAFPQERCPSSVEFRFSLLLS